MWSTNQLTLGRASQVEDTVIPPIIKKMKLTKDDFVIFCFGEIDIRCYVKPTVEHRKSITLDGLLETWAKNYCHRISLLDLNNAGIVIMSIVPPSRKVKPGSFKWPVGGSGKERALYTKTMNQYLKRECETRKWLYLDIYSYYVDEEGMLPLDKTDDTVHIIDKEPIAILVKEFIMLSRPNLSRQFPCKINRETLTQEIINALPKFLIIGAAKCGTTSLCDNLDQHSKLSLASLKEPNFFAGQRHYRIGINWYINLWKDTPKENLRFEGSTLTIFAPCHERIKGLIPDIKAILMLRNPVTRAWSHYVPRYALPPYNYPLSILTDPNSSVINRGIYLYQIKKWHEYFPKENLLIIRSEDYFANELDTIKTVDKFLGVDYEPPMEISKRDPWKEIKDKVGYPPIPKDIEEWLYKFYKPHNEALEEYLNRSFGWNKEV
jgi:hypothetical protein